MSSVNIFLKPETTLRLSNGTDSLITASNFIHPIAGESLSNLSNFLKLDDFSHNGSNVILKTLSYTMMEKPDVETINTLVNIVEPTVETNERMYPPIRNFTSANTTISGQSHGDGSYNVTSSTTFGNSWDPFTCFNEGIKEGGHWAVGKYTSGTYNGTESFDGGTYKGEWLQIKLPVSIKLTRYSFLQRTGFTGATDRAPKDFKIYGSNNNTTWDVLVDKRTITYASNSYEETVTTVQNYYQYYVLVVNKLVGTSETLLNFDEWYIYGKEQTTINPEPVAGSTTENYIKLDCGDTTSAFATVDKTYTITFYEDIICDVFMIAGGGSGGTGLSGGGGAGGYYLSTEQDNEPLTFLADETYTVIVGHGGTTVTTTDSPNVGSDGADTVIKDSLGNDILRVKGGGQGGADAANPSYNSTPRAGSNGGCGGGGSGYNDPDSGTNPRIAAGGLAVNEDGKGFDGGSGIQYKNYTNGTRYITAGGGGGIGGLGENAFNTEFEAGDGGNALTIKLTGNDEAYGGGGGGGAWTNSATRAVGGGSLVNGELVTVGGNGATTGQGDKVNCVPNTGSGGGGGNNNFSSTESAGGNGAGGVVIIRYKLTTGSSTSYTPQAILKYISPLENSEQQTKGTWKTIANPTQTTDFSFTLNDSSNFSNLQAKTTTNFFDLYHSNIYTHTTDSYRIILNATIDHQSTDGNKYITSALYYTSKPVPFFAYCNLSVFPSSDWSFSNISDKLRIGVTTSNLINNLKVSL